MRNFKNIVRLDPRKNIFLCENFVHAIQLCDFNQTPLKFFLSLISKTSQTAPKSGVAICSMLIPFPQEVMCVIPGFNIKSAG